MHAYSFLTSLISRAAHHQKQPPVSARVEPRGTCTSPWLYSTRVPGICYRQRAGPGSVAGGGTPGVRPSVCSPRDRRTPVAAVRRRSRRSGKVREHGLSAREKRICVFHLRKVYKRKLILLYFAFKSTSCFLRLSHSSTKSIQMKSNVPYT